MRKLLHKVIKAVQSLFGIWLGLALSYAHKLVSIAEVNVNNYQLKQKKNE